MNMSRAAHAILRDLAEAPNNPTAREVALVLLAKADPNDWREGPADAELGAFILQAGWKTHDALGDRRRLWAGVLSGLLQAARGEPAQERATLRVPDETWAKPRKDQGGD